MNKVLILILIATLTLSGCMSTPKQDYALLSNNHGFVSFSDPQGYYYPLTIRSKSTKKKYVIDPRYRQLGDHIGLWVPTGQYEIFDTYERTVGPDEYNVVEVQGGRITFLGAHLRLSMGNDVGVQIFKQSEKNNNIIKALQEDFLPFLSSKEVIKYNSQIIPKDIKAVSNAGGLGMYWILKYHANLKAGQCKDKNVHIKNVNELFDLFIKESVPNHFGTDFDDKGNTYFTSNFGVIKRRNSLGEWSNINTPSLHRLNAVTWQNGVLYAGDENGQVFELDKLDGQWKLKWTFGRNSQVNDIDIFNNKMYVVTSNYEKSNYISKVTVFDLKQIEPIKELKSRKTFWTGLNPMLNSYGLIHRNAYFLETPSGLFKMNFLDNTWVDINVNVSNLSLTIDKQDNLLLYGHKKKGFISKNMGESWTKVNHNTLNPLPKACKYLSKFSNLELDFCFTEDNRVLRFTNSKWIQEFPKKLTQPLC